MGRTEVARRQLTCVSGYSARQSGCELLEELIRAGGEEWPYRSGTQMLDRCIFVELNKMEQARHQSRAQRWTHVEGGEWLVLSVRWWTIMTITETAARW